jgi:hypothetical protein
MMVGGKARDETSLRDSLGIPADAPRVLVFAESSHWDPDWLLTSEEYFDRYVRRNLDLAVDGLLRDARRIYSIECIFFLRMYWERCPEQQERIRDLVNTRRLRLTHSGVTTADTLLPHPEAILRDFLLGQEWLRQNGMTQEPDVAYFSDSFGSSPSLPSLLQAAGFQRTAITRIDGMYFPALERNHPKRYPRPGSTADRLLNSEQTLDFVWRDRAGAEVLCHWNAFTYGQGDLLAHRGVSRVYLAPFAVSDRSDGHVARRIRRYASQLSPYSRSPYLFCPIGFDFVAPIPDLVSLLDRYNRKHYPSTGIWAVNAGLDDYLDLVNCHRQRLPVLELDPNPYWTGYYTSRPALKARIHQLVETLLLAERLSSLPEYLGSAKTLNEDIAQAWWYAAVANHHDFITGTSPDRVVEQEQIPWVEEALRISSEKVSRFTPAHPELGRPGDPSPVPPWSRHNGRLHITTPAYFVEVDEQTGGAILTIEDPTVHEALAVGLCNDLISYRDTGGLWRMGYEFRGGTWKEDSRASDDRAPVEVQGWNGGLDVSWTSTFWGETVQRRMWLGAASTRIFFRVIGRAPWRRTLTVRFSTGITAGELVMDTPGGVVARPLERLYSPTFWPFQRFVHIRDRARGRGLAIFQRLPGAVSCRPDGTIELVALRNAVKERAYGLFPLTGNPAKGFEKLSHTYELAVEFTQDGDWLSNDLPAKAYAHEPYPWDDPVLSERRALGVSQVVVDRPDVWVLASKPASRGEGRILRLYTLTGVGQAVGVRVNHARVQEAFLCDARERDLQPLEVRDGSVRLRMPGTIASVRLLS